MKTGFMNSKTETAEERKKRLARALKANIAKRKAQAKRRESSKAERERVDKQ